MRKKLEKMFNRDDPAGRRTFYHSMELLAVAAIALAIGFFAGDLVKGSGRALASDANSQRPGHVVPADTSPPLRPSGEIDPSIKQPVKGSDQHG